MRSQIGGVLDCMTEAYRNSPWGYLLFLGMTGGCLRRRHGRD